MAAGAGGVLLGGEPIWIRDAGCQLQTPLLQAHLEPNLHINCQLMCLHKTRISPREKLLVPGRVVSSVGWIFSCFFFLKVAERSSMWEAKCFDRMKEKKLAVKAVKVAFKKSG